MQSPFSPGKYALLPIAATLLLAGCMVQENRQGTVAAQQSRESTGVAQGVAVPGGGMAPQAPGGTAPAPAAGSAHVISKVVAAGQTIEIMNMHTVNPDCTPGETGTVKITLQPMHGTAVVVQRDSYPNFPPNNPRAVCNKTRVPGVAVDYTPNAGFTGSDLMAVQPFFHSGMEANEMKVVITVK